MYALPEMEAANSAFWAALKQRLHARGVNTAGIELDSNADSVRPGIEAWIAEPEKALLDWIYLRRRAGESIGGGFLF